MMVQPTPNPTWFNPLNVSLVDARKVSIGPIVWMNDYEAKADARQAAWEQSPFYDAVVRLFANKGTSEIGVH